MFRQLKKNIQIRSKQRCSLNREMKTKKKKKKKKKWLELKTKITEMNISFQGLPTDLR